MIPKILNPGNVVPVYPNIDWQMRYQCGCEVFNWAIPVKRGSVLQIQIPVPPDMLTGWYYNIFGEDGTNYDPMSSLTTGIEVQSTLDGTKAWLTLRNYSAVIPEDCDTFYIRFDHADLRGEWYTELFRFFEFSEKEKIYKLTFYNSTDVDGILYQLGYIQSLWLMDAVWDVPEVVEGLENIVDGDAVDVPTFQSIQRRAVLKFPYFPDFWQGVFHRLKMHSSVTLTKEETAETIEINGKNIEFLVEDQDVCFTKGKLSWIESTQVMTNCNDNYILNEA